MNSTEFQLWEAAWRRLLGDALPGLLVDPETAIDEEGNALTLDHLVGEGRWVAPTDQATAIPPKALHVSRDTAITAFFGMAPDGPIVPYSKIFQGPKESFTSFVERLTRAIELQVADTAVRPGILREMAFNNANAPSRNAILSLPLYPPPTVPDMLQVCQVKVPLLQATDNEQRPRNPRIAALGSTTSLNSGPPPQRKPYVPNQRRLRLTAGLHLKNTDWTVTSVNLEEQGTWPVTEAVTEKRPTQKLNWLTDSPVWVEQWPLSKEKLKALEELVEEQLAKGHIVETNSPWNSPIFVIKKPGKDKWRLLHDLRQINNVIEDMGSLQPGMPSPTMLPENWNLAVIDIKDCFFQIPLHPNDAPRFAFSVPTINRAAPRRRYHWRVLPQGMKNSPVICQWYVASLLSPVRAAADKAIIYHYMDDVLVCAPSDDDLSHALDLTINSLIAAGFELQSEKVQRMPPWRYLGLEISKRTIVPQKLEIKTKVSTLADLHQLCGSLNWVRPWLGLSTEDLAPLFNLLKGGEELSSPRVLTPEAELALQKVQECMSKRQAHRCDPGLPFKFIVMGRLPHLHGVIFQWKETPKKDRGKEDPLLIIEWVFLSHQRSKRMTRPQELVAELIRKARSRIRDLAGCDFECIHVPIGLRSGQITKAMLEHLIQENESLQFALDSFTGQISIHRPAHKIFNQDNKFVLSLKSVQSRRPLKALTIFTDASGRSHKSVLTWKDQQTQRWEADVEEVEGSPQIAELAAVVRAFEKFSEPFNLVTDSAYVVGVVSRAEQSILQEVPNIALFNLLSKLVKLVFHREQPFFVMHVRSHTDLPGFIAEGNRRADALAAPAAMAPLPSIFEQAKLSHQLHHQNAPGLVRRFHLTREQAKAIVAACPSCSKHALPTFSAGVNPRGLRSCEVWQTDVTHFPEFGRTKYVHVSVDTFSGAVYASAHTGEKSSDAVKHLIQAFSFLGIPRELKTDNGPTYRSREFRDFLQQWGVEHKTGIPHSPTGQAVVERTHQNIKRVLHQQHQVLKTEPPSTRLARALFTLNFLNCSFEGLNPPVIRHFGASPQFQANAKPPVMVKDPETGKTDGPHGLVTWGRGYACVSTPTGPKWIPSKWVRPYVPKVSGTHGKRSVLVTEAVWRRRRRETGGWEELPFSSDLPILD
ncbi:hypothetical protein DUI87_22985 [Hirundo rustica rustica]|uniref:Uncharacterized protein n=1 Tax=Hirundo rustica rustica TaxID=333673 RepID=A0A3M0JZS0_HIRRU|nr:hypothetical protein DUI87_22985 [Hirundo rustica rustica]